jgi:hypothetical protein
MKLFFALLLLAASALAKPASNYVRFTWPTGDVNLVNISGICSGFVSEPGIVYTAAHCTKGSRTMKVCFSDLSCDTFQVVAEGSVEKNDDYAVLVGKTGTRPGLSKRLIGELQPEQRCLVLTSRNGAGNSEACPCLTRPPSAEPMDKNLIIVHAEIRPGDSGSPAILKDDVVFGIVVQHQQPAPWGGVTPISSADKALATWRANQK